MGRKASKISRYIQNIVPICVVMTGALSIPMQVHAQDAITQKVREFNQGLGPVHSQGVAPSIAPIRQLPKPKPFHQPVSVPVVVPTPVQSAPVNLVPSGAILAVPRPNPNLHTGAIANAQPANCPPVTQVLPEALDGVSGFDAAFSGDSDYGVVKAFLGKKSLCAYAGTVEENGKRWRFQILKHPTKLGPLWAVPHDNERPPIGTAVWAVKSYGGTVITLETQQRRIFFGQDPNRNFSVGNSPKCLKYKRSPSPRFVTVFLRHLDRGQPIVALHSNSVGGGLTINSKFRGEEVFRTKVRSKYAQNIDTFIYMGATKSHKRSVLKLKDRILAKGLNVRFENVTAKNFDCSMSKFAAWHFPNFKYVNIEVPDNVKSTYQINILKSILPLIR